MTRAPNLPTLLLAMTVLALPASLRAQEAPAEAPEAAPAEAPEAAPEEAAAEEAAAEGEAVAVETVEAEAAEAEAEAEEAGEGEAEEEASEEPKKPWSVGVSLGANTGMILFHPTRYTRSYYSTFVPSVGVTGNYMLSEEVAVSGMLGASFELTTPNNPSARRFNWSDPSFAISHSSLYKDEKVTGINLSGSASASLGLSLPSLNSDHYASFGVGVSAGRAFFDKKLNASLSLNGGLNASRAIPTQRPLWRSGVNRVICETHEQFNSGKCPGEWVNSRGSMGATVAVSYQATKKLGLMANFGLSRAYSAIRYPVDDPLAPKAVDTDGNPVAVALGKTDMMMGGFGLNYMVAKGYSLAAGFATGGMPFAYYDTDVTEPNKSLRFPFWDPRLMSTSFYLRVGTSF